MKIKCIDNSKAASDHLVVGEIYDVSCVSSMYSVIGLKGMCGPWYAQRFVPVPENACLQCGEIHP
jgi:hypothetical protein